MRPWQLAPGFIHTMEDTTRISCMALVILTGVVIFGHFLAITRIPFELAHWVSSLPLPNSAIMTTILLIFFPVSQALGYDPIWFGVVMVLICEIGVVTSPVGINVYVVYGIANDVPLETIFRGVWPMLLALIAGIVLLMLFPGNALFLPGLMWYERQGENL